MNISREIILTEVIDGLKQLSDRELQERLWLSDGSSGEVSSFEEAVCGVFDDGCVTRAMEKGRLPAKLAQMFDELNKSIRRVPDNPDPSTLIDHPAMQKINKIAATILKELEVGEDHL